MKRFIPFLVLAAALMALSGGVIGQEKKGRPGTKATPEDYRRLAALRTYTGKVSVGPKSVTIKFDDSAYMADLKAATALPIAQQKIAMAKVEQKYLPSKWALGKEFELDLSDKCALRRKNLPFEYDEKGFPKVSKVGPGSGGLPGYPAKMEDFGADAITTVTFGAMKDGKPTVAMIYVDNK
ncbi:MAG: hypothetical protein WCL32_04710 [Planctomycetota bacterium]